MNKILFLDIDGVLNSVDNMIVSGYLWQIDKTNKSRDEYGHLFDERCVRWLKYIIEQTKCQLVISSTWRSMGIERLKIMWKLRDLRTLQKNPTNFSCGSMSESNFKHYFCSE